MTFRVTLRSIRALAMAVAAAAAVVVVALGLVTFLVVHEEIERQIDHRIELETMALTAIHRTEGFEALLTAVRERDRQGGPGDTGYLAGVGAAGRGMGYIVTDAEGRRRAGALDAAVPPPGWSEFVRFRRPDGSTGVAQAMNSVLTGEGRLVVAADRAIVNRMDMALLKIFLVEVGLILLVIAAAAAGFARIVHVRLAAIRGSAEAIMGGDLARRMPIDSSNSEFDQLSAVLNRMLDRISALLENLRQVSSDLAHDLRTPLTRLRNRIEAAGAAAGSEAGRAELEAALRDADGVLELFTGVLAISEIEGQDLRGRFTAIRLDELVAEVAEAYEPALDAAQVTLTREFSPAVVLGHRGLLQRAVANLMDNLIGHTPAGARARVAVGASDGEVRLEVSDNGPGVPSEDAARIVERFVRLDPARSSPGHGLGLSMVAAIVAAHGGALSIRPADPGLVVRISLPAALPATAQAAA